MPLGPGAARQPEFQSWTELDPRRLLARSRLVIGSSGQHGAYLAKLSPTPSAATDQQRLPHCSSDAASSWPVMPVLRALVSAISAGNSRLR